TRLFLSTCKFRRLYFVACYLFCRLQLLSLQGLTFVNHLGCQPCVGCTLVVLVCLDALALTLNLGPLPHAQI
ncbi:hypothetical protein FB446DRAFT_758094, partial [Lentinula raphanica]